MTLPQPPLSLVFDAEGARATAAFFIPGTDAQVWLDEMAAGASRSIAFVFASCPARVPTAARAARWRSLPNANRW
jgi:hypothetical protein